LAIVEAMKKKFKLENFVTKILAGKVMRKCHMDEVLMPMVSLVMQCRERVDFN